MVRREDGSILIINYDDMFQLKSQPMESILPSSSDTSNFKSTGDSKDSPSMDNEDSSSSDSSSYSSESNSPEKES